MLFAHSMDIGAVSYTMHLISSRYSADTMLPDVVCSQYRSVFFKLGVARDFKFWIFRDYDDFGRKVAK